MGTGWAKVSLRGTPARVYDLPHGKPRCIDGTQGHQWAIDHDSLGVCARCNETWQFPTIREFDETLRNLRPGTTVRKKLDGLMVFYPKSQGREL